MGIKFNNVSYWYQKPRRKQVAERAIDNITLSLGETPEFVMIVGKTGVGKSTLLSHINGLLLPSEGSIDVDNFHITRNVHTNPKLKQVRKKIGYVFQFPEYQLFSDTVLNDIAYGAKNFGATLDEANKIAREVAATLNIENILDNSPFEISGGQKRKVAIAGIVAYQPDVYLLDEPTRGLDPRGSVEVMEFFNGLFKNEGKTIIMITHDMDLVYQYATRVLVLADGKIKFDGKKEELFKEEYQKYGLEKPHILALIDLINKNTKYNISYENYTEDDLIKSLEAAK